MISWDMLRRCNIPPYAAGRPPRPDTSKVLVLYNHLDLAYMSIFVYFYTSRVQWLLLTSRDLSHLKITTASPSHRLLSREPSFMVKHNRGYYSSTIKLLSLLK